MAVVGLPLDEGELTLTCCAMGLPLNAGELAFNCAMGLPLGAGDMPPGSMKTPISCCDASKHGIDAVGLPLEAGDLDAGS